MRGSQNMFTVVSISTKFSLCLHLGLVELIFSEYNKTSLEMPDHFFFFHNEES